MCGRYSLEADVDSLIERYKAIIMEQNFMPKPEIFPTNMVPVVRKMDNIQINQLKWGFMPSYAKSPLINGRSETIDVKPTFKDAFINKRCIIPATSFFEWEKVDDKKIKREIRISEEDIFSIAGLYNTFYDKDGVKYEAFTILTTSSNDSMKHIHERMPVIIPKSAEEFWIDNENKDIFALRELLMPWRTEMIIK